MFAYHLVSMRLIRRAAITPSRWLRAVHLVRFEALYYLTLAVFVLWTRSSQLLFPLLVLGTLHVAFWLAADARPGWVDLAGVAAGRRERVLLVIQIFDWAEAAVLVWIAWALLQF